MPSHTWIGNGSRESGRRTSSRGSCSTRTSATWRTSAAPACWRASGESAANRTSRPPLAPDVPRHDRHARPQRGRVPVCRGREREGRAPAHPPHDLGPLVRGAAVDSEHDVAGTQCPADGTDRCERPGLDPLTRVRGGRERLGDEERGGDAERRGDDEGQREPHPRPPQHPGGRRRDEEHDERQRDDEPPVCPRVVRGDAGTVEGQQGRPGRDEERAGPARQVPLVGPGARHLPQRHDEGDEGDGQGRPADPPGEPADRLLRIGAAPVDRQPLPQLQPRDDVRAGVLRRLAHHLPPRPAREPQTGDQGEHPDDVGDQAPRPVGHPHPTACRDDDPPRPQAQGERHRDEGNQAGGDRAQVAVGQGAGDDPRHRGPHRATHEQRPHHPRGRPPRDGVQGGDRQQQGGLAQPVDPDEHGRADEEPREAGAGPRGRGARAPAGGQGEGEQPRGEGQHGQRLGVGRAGHVQHGERQLGAGRGQRRPAGADDGAGQQPGPEDPQRHHQRGQDEHRRDPAEPAPQRVDRGRPDDELRLHRGVCRRPDLVERRTRQGDPGLPQHCRPAEGGRLDGHDPAVGVGQPERRLQVAARVAARQDLLGVRAHRPEQPAERDDEQQAGGPYRHRPRRYAVCQPPATRRQDDLERQDEEGLPQAHRREQRTQQRRADDPQRRTQDEVLQHAAGALLPRQHRKLPGEGIGVAAGHRRTLSV